MPTPRVRRPRSPSRGDPTEAAIASALAGEIYGLEILKRDIEDAEHNTTRFLVMARGADRPRPARRPGASPAFVFRVRSVPAALYKALGGFATNGVNMTKLESYMVDGRFTATQFYVDVEGHPEERPVRLALEELRFFSREVRILGVYPASPQRHARPDFYRRRRFSLQRGRVFLHFASDARARADGPQVRVTSRGYATTLGVLCRFDRSCDRNL